MKSKMTWYSHRVERHVTVARWGEVGMPVLVFPTAGGDAEEIERHHLVDAMGPLLAAGRIKVYSVDSVAGSAWRRRESSPEHCAWLQNRFDAFVHEELAPAIRADCRLPGVEIITAGASFGAFYALASLCRHPETFRLAVCMSGTFDFSPLLDGRFTDDFYFSSPLHFLPGLGESPQLHRLRHRFVILATGSGAWEDAGESWRVAGVLGAKGIPNRVDDWGPDRAHAWETWREMLPKYLHEHV